MAVGEYHSLIARTHIYLAASSLRLRWRHKERHDVLNHQQLDGLFNYLFKLSSKTTLPTLCEGKPPVTDGFPSQKPVRRKAILWLDVIIVIWRNGLSTQRAIISTKIKWSLIRLRKVKINCHFLKLGLFLFVWMHVQCVCVEVCEIELNCLRL